MNLTTINATKIARRIQLCQTFICHHESNARRALVPCNWLTTKSSLWKSPTTTFYQNNLLRKRIINKSVSNRSHIICLTSSTDKSQQLLSLTANVRHFIGKIFSTVISCGIFLDNMAKSNEFQRLPLSVVPKHYNLELQPDLIGFTFTGKVAIKIQVRKNYLNRCVCTWFLLHIKDGETT